MPTLQRPGEYSRLGLVRKWWHLAVLHHTVAGTVVRAMREKDHAYDFYYRKGWTCIDCKALWP